MEDWKFPELPYERPDLDEMKTFLREARPRVENAGNLQDVLDVVNETEKRGDRIKHLYTLAYFRNTLNTTDAFYEAEIQWWNDQMPELSPYQVALSEAFAESRFRPELEKKLGKQFFTQIDIQKRSFCEKNIPLIQRESRLTQEYQKIMATCAIPFNGETCNLYGIQKYFQDTDRKVRAAAYKAYADFYHQHEQRLEEIWDELITLRNEMGRNLGFENFIPLGYLQQGRTDYGEAEVAAFREQVHEVLVPLCEKLYDAQAKRLGIDHMMAYDEKMIFPEGNAHPIGDEEFLVGEARKMYHDISPETGEFIDFMIDHELMDLANKPNKASTGYMTSLPDLKAPVVFSCFNGTTGDIHVLNHELGHAFAGYMAMRHQHVSEYYDVTTDIAEIHSMSMEQFCYPYAEFFFGDAADKFRFSHLQDAVTFVPFGVAVDEFQHICYSHPELTPKERTYEWHKLEEKYMPWRRYEEDGFMERGGWWYHKLHIFLYPFYYINYTLTTMGAMEFKRKNAENHEAAWADYLELCKVGASMSYLETLRHANLSVPFEEGTVRKVMAFPEKILLDQVEKLSA